jgi:hypothetical protein
MKSWAYLVALVAIVSSPLFAVVTLDLTTTGASVTGTANIGGTFRVDQINPQSTGTGVIDPFVRIQANRNEHGYNTSLGTPLDTKAGNFTRALLLSEIPVVTLGGIQYRQFLLDINQNSGGTNEILNLNQIQIFQSSADRNDGVVSPAATATSAPAIGFSGGTATTNEIFRMSNTASGAYNTIKMDYSLNAGSGSGDMFLYVANSLFTISPTLTNVIMYSQFGNPPGGAGSNDGFEEWSVLKASGTPCTGCEVVPEPMSVWLLGTAVCGVAFLIRRKRLA